MSTGILVETLHLFPILDKLLIELLSSLSEEEWQAKTVAKQWVVKDVAAHLLDGNLRGLSTSRDKYFGEPPGEIKSYQDLVDFINRLNLTWTNAAKRLSPTVLINLLETTGKEYVAHLGELPPFENALFAVDWAGQKASPNWFHIAREYTEKFLHQQQIRDAVGRQGIITKELFYPFIDTLMFAFPHTFKNIEAATGTIVSIEIESEAGGQWSIIKTEDTWVLEKNPNHRPAAQVVIDPHTAWKLFSKSWRPTQVADKVRIVGDKALGLQALQIVAFMA